MRPRSFAPALRPRRAGRLKRPKAWPAMVSQIIIVMLGSAVCGQISTQELSYAANLIQGRNFRAFEAFIIATLIYLVLSIAVRKLLNWAGPKFLFGR